MSDINTVVIGGRLVRNADVKKLSENNLAVKFVLASNRFKKNKDGEYVDKVSFFPVRMYTREDDKRIGFLVKGERVAVEGYIEQYNWEKDGKKKSYIQIIANKLDIRFEKANLDKASDKTDDEFSEYEPAEEDGFIDDIDIF